MKKLIEKLKKIDFELNNWTRNVFYEHILEVCKDLSQNHQFVKKHKKFKIEN
ncbi:MAG: hypothetical protein ACFFDN_51440 [Candidatus Hodarchaeota archaeon]